MKRIAVFSIAIVFTATSCVHQSGYDEFQSVKNRESVRQLFKAFNDHDFKTMASFYADTAKFLDPSLGKDYVMQSPKQTADKYGAMAAMFPDLKDSVTHILTTDKHIIAQFISKGTSADGKSFSLPICSIFEFKDGKIVSDATYYDTRD